LDPQNTQYIYFISSCTEISYKETDGFFKPIIINVPIHTFKRSQLQ
jgi:hypothetical protein